jgi:CubicO group peptidase (beta-lactamase class C family)
MKKLAIPFVAASGIAVIMALVLVAPGRAAAGLEAGVDKIFTRWTPDTPGCAVGVGVDGSPELTRGYGMADLEHGVPIKPDTIFEAGSVSKQFTAAAVLLLAKDGKLSLDDPVRKYVAELPDFGTPLTIRHMLTHTSGLRDWGSVAGISGWGRTTRVHTHAHVLEILGRQKSLNFQPGTRYSYSNSGYNLAAIIVARVSGMSFAEFTAKHLFQPLGMKRTSWRDDYTRVVKDRAIAYEQEKDGYHTLMPFENVYGNGGLLTTVGDLLIWNERFDNPPVRDAALVREQQQPGRFSDNRAHGYALGLMVGPYKGLRQVAHSGSTAGYSAYLARYPDQRVSVAVLCNAATNATGFAHEVADLYLGERLRPSTTKATHDMSADDFTATVGLYRRALTGAPLTIVRDGNGIRLRNGSPLLARSATRFVTPGGETWDFDRRGRVRVTDEYGTVDDYQRVDRATPTADELSALTGTYVSDDAETPLRVAVEGQRLVLKRRPDTTINLTPEYADAFTGTIGTVLFRRDASGRPVELSVVQDRVWDMRFSRQ